MGDLRAAVDRARAEGHSQKAHSLCQKLLEQNPEDGEVSRLAAEIQASIQDKEVEQLCGLALSYAADADTELAQKIAGKIERLAPKSARYLQLRSYLDEEVKRRKAQALIATAADHLPREPRGGPRGRRGGPRDPAGTHGRTGDPRPGRQGAGHAREGRGTGGADGGARGGGGHAAPGDDPRLHPVGSRSRQHPRRGDRQVPRRPRSRAPPARRGARGLRPRSQGADTAAGGGAPSNPEAASLVDAAGGSCASGRPRRPWSPSSAPRAWSPVTRASRGCWPRPARTPARPRWSPSPPPPSTTSSRTTTPRPRKPSTRPSPSTPPTRRPRSWRRSWAPWARARPLPNPRPRRYTGSGLFRPSGGFFMRLVIPVLVAAVALGAAPRVSAQSLGEIAEKEKERRSGSGKTSKVITESDLQKAGQGVPVLESEAPVDAEASEPVEGALAAEEGAPAAQPVPQGKSDDEKKAEKQAALQKEVDAERAHIEGIKADIAKREIELLNDLSNYTFGGRRADLVKFVEDAKQAIGVHEAQVAKLLEQGRREGMTVR